MSVIWTTAIINMYTVIHTNIRYAYTLHSNDLMSDKLMCVHIVMLIIIKIIVDARIR